MSVAANIRRHAVWRWGLGMTLALGFHGAGAAALLAHWHESADQVANAPVVLVDLAPMAVAPTTVPNEQPPGPAQPEAQAEPEKIPESPVEKVELPPQPQAEPLVAVTPPKPREKPVEKKPKQKLTTVASAPSSAEQKSERAAAPLPGASARDPDALPNWKSQLVARLERYKRYPSEAQSRGEQGVAYLGFTVGQDGAAHNVRILRSSGSSLLDRETLALAERAQPLPPPPPGAGAIEVPIRYNFR